MSDSSLPSPKGRGSPINPPNRFEKTRHEPDFEQLEHAEEFLDEIRRPKTEYLSDTSKTIVSENDSPDIPFRFSLNPYRGCSHGCSYCYARPSHEYLGLSAGLDFETKIFVKHDAAALFREFLCRPKWKPEPIVLSGVTDPYQPGERDFLLTRRCLEVAAEARQPLDIITKNALILRDLDLLREMATVRLVRISVSITTLDAELARAMEPRTSGPSARMNAIRTLAAADVPVRVMVAPIIPGLNDSEIPSILSAAADAGAKAAGHVLLRLPLAVRPIFMAWLDRHRPSCRARVENAIRSTRGGALNSSKFGERMRGIGPVAEQVAQLFRTFAKRYELAAPLRSSACDLFRPPKPPTGQKSLF
jgi:DNA repair photolyase